MRSKISFYLFRSPLVSLKTLLIFPGCAWGLQILFYSNVLQFPVYLRPNNMRQITSQQQWSSWWALMGVFRKGSLEHANMLWCRFPCRNAWCHLCFSVGENDEKNTRVKDILWTLVMSWHFVMCLQSQAAWRRVRMKPGVQVSMWLIAPGRRISSLLIRSTKQGGKIKFLKC